MSLQDPIADMLTRLRNAGAVVMDVNMWFSGMVSLKSEKVKPVCFDRKKRVQRNKGQTTDCVRKSAVGHFFVD